MFILGEDSSHDYTKQLAHLDTIYELTTPAQIVPELQWELSNTVQLELWHPDIHRTSIGWQMLAGLGFISLSLPCSICLLIWKLSRVVSRHGQPDQSDYYLTWKMPYRSSLWLSRPKHIVQSDCFNSQQQSLSGFAVCIGNVDLQCTPVYIGNVLVIEPIFKIIVKKMGKGWPAVRLAVVPKIGINVSGSFIIMI